jgi:hypothetical protein
MYSGISGNDRQTERKSITEKRLASRLVHFHHGEQSFARDVAGREMKRLDPDAWQPGVHGPHRAKVIGSR